MAETAAPITSNGEGGPQPEADAALFHRRIEFHQARRQFNGFVSDSSNGFKLVTLNPSSGPIKVSGPGKKNDKSTELCEAGLDPELSFEISFRRIGAGLRNLGNTCFLNSVVQCLTYTAPLAAYLQSGKHQNSCRTAGFCALCAIQKHVSRALQSTGRILEPKDLVSNLRCISRSFRNARQEDAHEYMVNLLESMHKCCLPSGVPSESPSAYEKSLVHKIFGGRLRSQVKCMQCSYCSDKFDPFLDLSLEIPKADSLRKALIHFTAKEQLDGGSRVYQCDQCRQKVKALKQLTIHKAPQVLAIHLKRFSSDSPGQKIDRRVVFEPTLDLKPFVTGPYDGDLKYTLYGVLVHYGWNTHSGHYSCFVRTSSGMWYSLDDNQVVQVSEKRVLEQKAYMLFYVRDRKNVGPKNHVNGFQKENMVMNGIGNAANSKFNMELKEKIQNGSIERKLNDSCSAALYGKDAPVTPLPKETPSENMSSNINGKLTVQPLGVVMNPKPEPSLAPPTKAPPLTEHSSLEINSSVNGSGGASSLGHVSKDITCNTTSSIVEEQNTRPVVLPDCSGPQDSLHKKELSSLVGMPSGCENSDKEKPCESAEKPRDSSVPSTLFGDQCKVDGTISEMNASTNMPIGETRQPSIEINQDGAVPVTSCIQSSAMKTVCLNTEGTIENGKRIDVQSKLSYLPATTEPIRLTMTKKNKKDLKVKRKLFKHHAVTASFSSNILLGVGLCSRKKKHKQKKKRSVLKKSRETKDMLVENDLSSKQSAPETTSSQAKKTKCVSDGQKSCGDSIITGDVIENDFRKRILFDGFAVSAQATGISEGHQLRQAEVLSMLTSGMDEPTVGRWDDNGVSLSIKAETRASGTVHIGYVGDEWDEEYDRGKRKKVRVPGITFDGPNLFQQVANQRSKTKKAKLDRSRGNQPFRI